MANPRATALAAPDRTRRLSRARARAGNGRPACGPGPQRKARVKGRRRRVELRRAAQEKNKQLHEPGACHTPRARAARRSWRRAAAFNRRAPINIPCFPHAAASPWQRGLCRLPTGRGRSAPGLPCHTKRQALCNQATESAPPSITTPAAQHWPARLPHQPPVTKQHCIAHTKTSHLWIRQCFASAASGYRILHPGQGGHY